MDQKSATPDGRVSLIAARQHGVVSISQLLEAGLSPTAIRGRVQAGRLHRVHRGVYAVGHPGITNEGRWMAAVLASGHGAMLSHRSAAELWRLLKPRGGIVEVSLPSRTGRRRRPGILLHRRPSLTAESTTSRLGIPVTTSAQTISDLQSTAPPHEVRQAIRQAAVLGLRLPPDMTPDRTRSELERTFLRLCRHHELPTPEVNVRVGPLTVDFLWRERRLIVETDGYRFHRGRFAFEDDRNRGLKLSLRGFEVIHLSYRQVTKSPEKVAAMLSKRLRA